MRRKLPFDKEKAYYYRRQGVIAGGDFRIIISPSDVVECFEEIISVKKFEDGMRDRGAHLYFAGKKEGTAEVTLTFFYPTCEPEDLTFTLNVDKNLNVTEVD